MKKVYTICLILFSFVTVSFAQDMPGLQVGDQAPDFIANDFRGEKVQLSKHYKTGQ